MKIPGLVIATRWEAAPLIRTFHFQRLSKDLYKLERQGQSAYLIVGGVGKEPARAAAYRLCDLGAGELVSAGYCGALVPDLHIGDLVTDRIATSSTALWARADRLAFASKAGARAVDMETQAIIEAGTRRGVPIRVLRVVSDRLGDDATPLLGTDGDFSLWRILLRLMNPLLWPYAHKYWQQSRIANRHLVQAIAEYLKEAGVNR